MKLSSMVFLAAALVPVFTSCGSADRKEIIAEKIQYDVNIKSPDPEYDWWIQNLVGPQRDNLVNCLMDGAVSGKFQAYDYFNNELTAAQVRQLLSDTMLVQLTGSEPPYEERDTLIIQTIERKDILRIRFLEEWKLNSQTLQMEKIVLGIGPVARRIDQNGNERWQPLFWIYTDEDFINNIKQKKN